MLREKNMAFLSFHFYKEKKICIEISSGYAGESFLRIIILRVARIANNTSLIIGAFDRDENRRRTAPFVNRNDSAARNEVGRTDTVAGTSFRCSARQNRRNPRGAQTCTNDGVSYGYSKSAK